MAPGHAGSRHRELNTISSDIRQLLDRIDRETPLLQLAITASGESLSTSLPTSISPSRLLQASTLLIVGDTQYAQDPSQPVQIGPSFYLSLYMLFLGHSCSPSDQAHDQSAHLSPSDSSGSGQAPGKPVPYGCKDGERKPLWQEFIHKARVRLCRVPPVTSCKIQWMEPNYRHGLSSATSEEYAYLLEIVEDFDDGRVHEDPGILTEYDDMLHVGTRRFIPLYQIAKIFYADTGKILNIGNTPDGGNSPVLLLKRDVAVFKRAGSEELHNYEVADSMINEAQAHEQAQIDRQLLAEGQPGSVLLPQGSVVPDNESFPAHLDPEWIALEVYEEDSSSTTDDTESFDMADEPDQPVAKDSKDGRQLMASGQHKLSSDSGLMKQMQHLSVRHNAKSVDSRPSSTGPQQQDCDKISTQEFAARSPFNGITSSLSLVEMLIRLASLQEFQQTSHLSIPDHILTFFLEEASTTGLTAESQRRARQAAKERVGFDPYTDSPPAE